MCREKVVVLRCADTVPRLRRVCREKAAVLRCADTVPRLRRARRDISEVKKGQALQNGKDETDGRYWT